MSKLIIDNRTNKTYLELWPYLQAVLFAGLQSNDGKQHSYATTWPNGIVVESVLNDKSERLVIFFDPERVNKAYTVE